MEPYWDILDSKRKELLPLLKAFSDDGFYLAGGTGLALQLGHRMSEDFDFFKNDGFDTAMLMGKIESVFKGHEILKTQDEKNTLSCSIDNDVSLSFITHDYPLQKPLIRTQYFDIASEEDIACMKLSAVSGRAVKRDYVDVYFILQKYKLDDLLQYCKQKYPVLDKMIVLKSLSYFDDVKGKYVVYKEGVNVTWEEVKDSLSKTVNEYIRNIQLNSVRKRGQERDIER